MIASKKPVSMHEKMTKNEHSYNTRMWVHVKDGKDGPLYGSNLKIGPNQSASHTISQRSFRWRTSAQWNKLPLEIRHSKTAKQFKKSLKEWIKENVPLKVGGNC